MGQVAVNVNGRSYRFDCGDGEEARLQELAAYIKDRIDTLKREYGQVGAERLMLMAALLITDELWDARAAIAEAAGAKGQHKASASAQVSDQPNGQTSVQAGGPTKSRAGADKREQDAIRSEYRRKVASGEV